MLMIQAHDMTGKMAIARILAMNYSRGLKVLGARVELIF